jgi:GTP pyrophosphokinase
MPEKKFNKEKMLRNLLKKCKEKKDRKMVKKAFNYSFEAHKHQKRLSGEPFFVHPYYTALKLAEWGLDNKTIAAGLLHDIIEDTKCSSKELIDRFGTEICELVIGTTQTHSKLRSKETIKARALRETLLASMEKINPIIIKLADKLHNLKTLEYLPEKRRKEIAKAALTVYSPIAEKLGMNDVKYRIERKAFPYAYPKEFKKIENFLKESNQKKSIQIKKAIEKLKPGFGRTVISFEELKKPASIIYRKTLKKRELKSIYDNLVLSIIVKSKPDCYKAMGLIHGIFPPVPGKIKDFIAIPKNEFYCAIHTTVIGPEGIPMKIYIKSKEMNELAKKGILLFLEKKRKEKQLLRKQIQWIQKIQKSKPATSKQLASSLGIDGIAEKTIVFDSKGNMIEIPQNSNAIDFFFFKDAEKAAYLKGVRINKKKARFNSKVQAGNIIEGEYGKKPTINERWLLLTELEETDKKIKKEMKKHGKKLTAKFYTIKITIKNIPGMLAKVTSCTAKHKVNIENIFQEEIDIETGRNMFIEMEVNAKSKKQMNELMKDLKEIKEAKRVTKVEI